MNNNIKQEINKIEIPEELSERGKLGVTKAKLEMDKSKRKWPFILAPALAVALALGIFAPSYFTNNLTENPVTKTIEHSSAFDISDPQRLVGWADNVFIGTVLKQDGAKSIDGIPETQFEVEVSDNIKGDINGTVIVNQQGGYKDDELILVENDQLLQEGKSYLFVTKHLEEEGWNTLVPVYGDILIATNEDKINIVEKYKKAYAEEIPFELN